MADSSRQHAVLPPVLQQSSRQRAALREGEAGEASADARLASARDALRSLQAPASTRPARPRPRTQGHAESSITFSADNKVRHFIDDAADTTAARSWLSSRGFSEPEMEEVEALLEQFNTQALEELGEDGVRARIQEISGGAASSERRQLSPLLYSHPFRGGVFRNNRRDSLRALISCHITNKAVKVWGAL